MQKQELSLTPPAKRDATRTLKVACLATPSRFDKRERCLELFNICFRMRHETTACQARSTMGTTNSAISTAAPKVNLSRSGQRLVLAFEGNWSVRHTQHREIDNLFSELDHQTPAEALQFDMSQLSSWDTSLLIVVVRAEEWCREHKVKFLGDSLPPNIASLVALAEEVPERKTGRGNKTSASLFEHIGKKTIAAIGGIESTLQFTGETVLSFGRILRGKAAFDWRLFWLTMEECSAQALPIVGLISFLTGLIFGFVGARSTSTIWSGYLRRQFGGGRHGSRNGCNYDRDNHGRSHWSSIRGPDWQHEGL